MNDSISNVMSHSLDLLRDTYNYNHWIFSLLRPYLGERVLEVGSGPGNLTRFLLDRRQLVCLEPDAEYQHLLGELTTVHQNIRLVSGTHESIPGPEIQEQGFDSVVCLNVLEHIEADSAALQKMRSALAPGGTLLLYVPACSWAYGEIDRGLGHLRRYDRRPLIELVRSAGFAVERCRFVNLPGAFGWWWAGRIRKERFIDPVKARTVDRIVPFLAAIERLIPPWIGQSLFLVGRRVR